jgi:hypothetical protein
MDRLSPAVVDRLVKLLGLLSSAHDGEVANAGRMADQLIRRYGLTWADIIAAPIASIGWRDKVRACLDCIGTLNAKEQQFICSLVNWRGMPTDRQLAWLDRIFANLP